MGILTPFRLGVIETDIEVEFRTLLPSKKALKPDIEGSIRYFATKILQEAPKADWKDLAKVAAASNLLSLHRREEEAFVKFMLIDKSRVERGLPPLWEWNDEAIKEAERAMEHVQARMPS